MENSKIKRTLILSFFLLAVLAINFTMVSTLNMTKRSKINPSGNVENEWKRFHGGTDNDESNANT